MNEKTKTLDELGWWTENLHEADNIEGVKILDSDFNPGGRMWSVGSVYEDNGIVMVAIVEGGDVFEFPTQQVEPVFRENRAASGLVEEKAVEALLEELQEAQKSMLDDRREWLKNCDVDPSPANPRTYLPEWAWPEYWQPNQKKAVVVDESPGWARDKLQPAVGDVYTIEFAEQRSPDGQALLSFIGRNGHRKTMAWTYFAPVKEE